MITYCHDIDAGHLTSLFEHSTEGIILTNGEGRIEHADTEGNAQHGHYRCFILHAITITIMPGIDRDILWLLHTSSS
jgi:hypothetical protein